MPEDFPEGLNPWLFHRIYCTTASGNVNETPVGTVYLPIWGPDGRKRAKGDYTGCWLRTKYLS
jgi:hypothetical protein